MRKKINFIFEVLFLVSSPIALESIINSIFKYPAILGYAGIVICWVGFFILIKKDKLILL
jgi:hypothetical protein